MAKRYTLTFTEKQAEALFSVALASLNDPDYVSNHTPGRITALANGMTTLATAIAQRHPERIGYRYR